MKLTIQAAHHRAAAPILQQRPAPMPTPVALTDEQMSALLAASYPLPPRSRSQFLAHCAQELAALPELGNGAVHRVVMKVQKIYFDPPDLDSGRMPIGTRKYG